MTVHRMTKPSPSIPPGYGMATSSSESSKATWMKCVAVHDYTRTFLEERTRPKRLALAIDYAWSAGIPARLPEEWLLYVLLYGIFPVCPA